MKISDDYAPIFWLLRKASGNNEDEMMASLKVFAVVYNTATHEQNASSRISAQHILDNMIKLAEEMLKISMVSAEKTMKDDPEGWAQAKSDMKEAITFVKE